MCFWEQGQSMVLLLFYCSLKGSESWFLKPARIRVLVFEAWRIKVLGFGALRGLGF